MTAIAIEPHKALIAARIEPAIHDSCHGWPELRQTGDGGLQHDPGGADLCDSVGLNLEASTEAPEREWV